LLIVWGVGVRQPAAHGEEPDEGRSGRQISRRLRKMINSMMTSLCGVK